MTLFSLKKGKIETANRKSLNRFLDRTEFQKRRQVFFEASCAYGKKKSRVAMCKKSGRPPFAIELKTQTTKQLRKTILEFLKDLGLTDVPALMKKSEKQLQAIARKKSWEAVLFLSDSALDKEPEVETQESPKGGMMGRPSLATDWRTTEQREADARAHERSDYAPLRLRDGGGKRQRGGRRGPLPGTKKHKKPRPQDTPEQLSRSFHEEVASVAPVEEMLAIRVQSKSPPPRQRSPPPRQSPPPRHRSPSPMHRSPPLSPIPREKSPSPERAPPVLRKEQKMKAAVQPKVRAAAEIVPEITQPVQTAQDRKVDDEKADDEKEKREKSGASDDEIRECYAIDGPEDACGCEPDPLSKVRLSKAQRKELNRINALRKLNCAKLNLLKCTLDLKRYQAKVWEADRQNCNGDYLALFGKNPKSKLNKIKDVTSPEGRDFLKAVLANQNATYRLKKGHEHLQKRLANQKGKLGKDFTLASMRYDQVLDEKAWSNDVFTQRALENREIEPPLEGKITCDTYKLPRIPPPPKCPEKTERPPTKNLSQLPKGIPQKESMLEQERAIEPVTVEQEREREPVERERERFIRHVPERQVNWAGEIPDEELRHIAAEHQPLEPPPLIHPAVQSTLDLTLRNKPEAMLDQPVARQRSVTIGAPEEDIMRQHLSGMQQQNPTPFVPPATAGGSPRGRAETAATVAELPYTPRESPTISPGPGPSSPKPEPPAVPDQRHYRVSVPSVMMSTPPLGPIISDKNPGSLREQLDREPLELTKSTSVIPRTPEKKPATAMLMEGLVQRTTSPEKKPQVVITEDTVLPRTPKKVSFEPISLPPLTLSPAKETPESLDRAWDQEAARLKQADYLIKKEFRSPLNLQFKYNRIPFLWEKIKRTKEIDDLDAAAFYRLLKPLLDQIPWVDTNQPIGTTGTLRWDWITKAQMADAVLENNPAHLSAERVIDLLRIIAPRQVQVKRQRLRYLEGKRAEAAQRKEDLRVRSIAVKERRRRRKRKPRAQEEPHGSGFKSRVGAMLKKRPKRKRKPSKRKPRKKAPVKQEVKKQEPVVEPKKVIDIPRSPKIKKVTKTAGKFPDFVRKRRNKKYLN